MYFQVGTDFQDTKYLTSIRKDTVRESVTSKGLLQKNIFYYFIWITDTHEQPDSSFYLNVTV